MEQGTNRSNQSRICSVTTSVGACEFVGGAGGANVQGAPGARDVLFRQGELILEGPLQQVPMDHDATWVV